MDKTFNMGVGMVAVVSAADSERALAMLAARHVPSFVIGEVAKATEDGPRVVLTGNHPGY